MFRAETMGSWYEPMWIRTPEKETSEFGLTIDTIKYRSRIEITYHSNVNIQ